MIPGLFFQIVVFYLINLTLAQIEKVPLRVGTAEFNGIVEGRSGLREYYAFKGIPYAFPPQRFKESQLKEIETREYDCTNFGSICMQNSRLSFSNGQINGSENCLFLNIYTKTVPANADGEMINLLPVIVYIHGGGLIYGSGDVAGPSYLMTEGKVVFITLNYRLGALGYLSTLGPSAKNPVDLVGNYGTSDQITALKWVQKYIRYFGGDSSRVTIFGHSAGGAAVHILTLSPKATGLFHRAIIISASALCPWAINPNPIKYAQSIGSKLGCETEETENLVKCLREASGEEIVRSQTALIDFWVFPHNSAHVVDGSILPKSPSVLLSEGKFNKVPILTGLTMDEGLMGSSILYGMWGDKFKNMSEFNRETLPRILKGLLREDLDKVTEIVKRTYFEEDIDDEGATVFSDLTSLFSDVLFNSCHREMLEKLSHHNESTVFSFVFSHKSPASPSIMSKLFKMLRTQGFEHRLLSEGVSHVEDMFYIFSPVQQIDGNSEESVSSQSDSLMQRIYTKSIISFAKDGDPNEGLSMIKGKWNTIKEGELSYFNFSTTRPGMFKDFKKSEALFWTRTVPYLRELVNEETEQSRQLELCKAENNSILSLFWVSISILILFFIIILVLAFFLYRKYTIGRIAF